jgi:hypothetical protein
LKRSSRILVEAIVVLLVSALMVTSVLAATDPFIGAWESIDNADGSYQVMHIGGGPGDSHQVSFRDFGASICDDPPFSGALEFAATARGNLTHSGDSLSGTLPLYCHTSPTVFWGNAFFDITYNPGDDTLTDSFGVTWSRR